MRSRQVATDGVLACVVGDGDLVRPLGLAGIRSAVVAARGEPVRFSRFATKRRDLIDAWEDPDRFVADLIQFASTQDERPVLIYQTDGAMAAISRHRDELNHSFRLVMPRAELVEDLVDKGRFQQLASRMTLPVPPACLVEPGSGLSPKDLSLRFPLVIKPVLRNPTVWERMVGSTKALRVDSLSELCVRWREVEEAGVAVLAQELVPGPESRIESYHVYVDDKDEIVGEFTGVKIRTRPTEYGHSCAVMITARPDIAALGRSIVRALELRGVAKLDFKRATNGELFLLEINPRFNLWHHPGACAGVNLPALVYRDLTGQPRAASTQARCGVAWCKVWADLPAARDAGLPLRQWLPWVLRCDTKRDIAWDDPGPIVGAILYYLRRKFS